jgi:hypothetical protein
VEPECPARRCQVGGQNTARVPARTTRVVTHTPLAAPPNATTDAGFSPRARRVGPQSERTFGPPVRYSLGQVVAHKTEPPLTVRSAEITVHSRLRLKVGRIFGTFFVLLESAPQVATLSARIPQTPHHENATWPISSLPKVNTPKQLCSDCNSIAASISWLVDFPDKTFALRVSANRSMPKAFPATATLQFSDVGRLSI